MKKLKYTIHDAIANSISPIGKLYIAEYTHSEIRDPAFFSPLQHIDVNYYERRIDNDK